MKHRKTIFKAIIAILFAGGFIAVSSWAFAQGSITGWVRHLPNDRCGNGKDTASVPEPGTLLLLSLGVIGMAGMRKILKK
jgi:hypothetical protein